MIRKTKAVRPLLVPALLLLLAARLPGPQQNSLDLGYLKKLIGSAQLSRAKALSDPLSYGYDLFFYANWPARFQGRGVPDPGKQFGDTGEVVWETWKNSSEALQPCGLKPSPWDTPEPVPTAVQKQPQSPADSGKSWQNMTANTQVSGFDLQDLQQQDILYEIRMNKSTFGYILKNALYNIDGQVRFAGQSGNGRTGDLNFDFDAMEVKASWHWLDPTVTTPGCRAQDYFTTNAYYALVDANGKFQGYKTGLMGLTGLHITTKAIPNWVWITFEQVNNEACIGSQRVIPIDPKVVAKNQAMKPFLKGKWANYMMVGTQIAMQDSAAKPITLANTQIEYAFQPRSSCMTCHSFASVATHFPKLPTDNLRKSFLDTTQSPPYYIGQAPPLGPPYKSMDFVWSLRRASRFQTGVCIQ